MDGKVFMGIKLNRALAAPLAGEESCRMLDVAPRNMLANARIGQAFLIRFAHKKS